MNQTEFRVRVHDEPPHGLWAEVVDLPGCFAAGADWGELTEALEEAIAMYLSSPSDALVVHLQWSPVADQPDDDSVAERRILVDA